MLGVNTTLAIDWVPSGVPRVFRSDSVAPPVAAAHVARIRVFFWACLLQTGIATGIACFRGRSHGESKVPRKKISAHHRRRRAFTSPPGAPRLSTVVWVPGPRATYKERKPGRLRKE